MSLLFLGHQYHILPVLGLALSQIQYPRHTYGCHISSSLLRCGSYVQRQVPVSQEDISEQPAHPPGTKCFLSLSLCIRWGGGHGELYRNYSDRLRNTACSWPLVNPSEPPFHDIATTELSNPCSRHSVWKVEVSVNQTVVSFPPDASHRPSSLNAHARTWTQCVHNVQGGWGHDHSLRRRPVRRSTKKAQNDQQTSTNHTWGASRGVGVGR